MEILTYYKQDEETNLKYLGGITTQVSLLIKSIITRRIL